MLFADIFSDYFWLAGVGSFLVGLSKGGLPSVGMLSVPLLSLMLPPMQATTLLLPIYVISDMVGIYLYRQNYSATNLKILIPAGMGGVLIGWMVVSSISDAVFSLLLGLVGVTFCLNMWLRKAPTEAKPPGRWAGYFWGALSGLTSFISHSGAPPFQMYILPQRLPKLVFAGTSTIFFAEVNLAKIYPYQSLRPYSTDMLSEALGLIPFAIAGTLVGAFLTKKINDKWFFLFIQISLFLVSLKLMAKGVG